MKKLTRVVIMAGGTGGHVYPGLALAHYLQEKGIDVHWLGTSQGLEARLVPAAGIPLHLITIGGLRGKGIKPLLTAPLKVSKAIYQSMQILKQIDPDMVVGMGGFVSGPGGMASWLLRRPLIIHEQNAKAGLTNQLLARFSKRVLAGFPSAFKPGPSVISIGNPVRSTLTDLPPPVLRSFETAPLRLLVLGGSLGAKALNDLIPQALALLKPEERPEVIHQTGEKHFADAEKSYKNNQVTPTLKPYIENMAEAYAWADLVVCRAGALTVAELCAVGRAAIFIPFPHAVDDHQTANANFMVSHQAALCLQQATLTPALLAETIKEFVASPQKCFKMAQAAYELRNGQVVERIFDILTDVINQQ